MTRIYMLAFKKIKEFNNSRSISLTLNIRPKGVEQEM